MSCMKRFLSKWKSNRAIPKSFKWSKELHSQPFHTPWPLVLRLRLLLVKKKIIYKPLRFVISLGEIYEPM